ncbi:unnamed protein product [Spirodela intermedia]|uniref:Methyltransferase n=1 Tax=Spirodela intermedia TaxID=51605 RepID=A0A7I8IAK9_SPIIN|nr:unnamed protein product [Spirodela intermedia]CAA6654709.1 unnamed protein product [Spirodela intermedia]
MRKRSGSAPGEMKYKFIVGPAVLLVVFFLTITNFDNHSATQSISSDFHPSPPADSETLQYSEQVSPSSLVVGEQEGGEEAVVDDARREEEDGGGVGGEQQWELCGKNEGLRDADYIPCLDNIKAIKALPSRKHMENRERHCPDPSPTCLVPLPQGYKQPVPWPKSRDMIWFVNVPHARLVEIKKEQNWVRKSDEYLVFPGGGTQFKDGVMHYIRFIEEHTRVVLDVGCGVASFGGYLLDKDVITMSLAPRDVHEAQIQFALERGIPANIPDKSYDMIHCARCRIHWHADEGRALLELNRILRPGGFFTWSATPIYRDDEEDKSIWNAMVSLTESICWKMVAKSIDPNGIGLAIFQKPTSNSCYSNRDVNSPPLCDQRNRSDISWYFLWLYPLLQESEEGSENTWPEEWPARLNLRPTSLSIDPSIGHTEESFHEDTQHWKNLVTGTYKNELGINWAVYGIFAAALVDQPLWVMNAVPPTAPDTLPIIFDRGFIGIYHDWCEAFNTYPRTYDLLHSNNLFGKLTQRCSIVGVVAEMDRILRPGGWVLIQDSPTTIEKLDSLFKSLHWETTVREGQLLVGKKTFWRPADAR